MMKKNIRLDRWTDGWGKANLLIFHRKSYLTVTHMHTHTCRWVCTLYILYSIPYRCVRLKNNNNFQSLTFTWRLHECTFYMVGRIPIIFSLHPDEGWIVCLRRVGWQNWRCWVRVTDDSGVCGLLRLRATDVSCSCTRLHCRRLDRRVRADTQTGETAPPRPFHKLRSPSPTDSGYMNFC